MNRAAPRIHAANCACGRCTRATPADRGTSRALVAIIGLALGAAITALTAAAQGGTFFVIFGATQ